MQQEQEIPETAQAEKALLMPQGRHSELTEEIKAQADEYIENYEDHEHAIPSVVGMAVVLNVAKSTLYKWAADNVLNFSDTLAKCKDWQEFVLHDKGLKNEINPTIAKLGLANFALPSGSLNLKKNSTPTETADAILKAVASGNLAPEIGSVMITALKSMVDIDAATEMKARIEEIEETLGVNRG